MKKKIILIAFMLIGVTPLLKAQWDTLLQFNQVISDMKVYNNKLFMAGNFTKNAGSTCYWSASYNGTTDRQTDLIGGFGIRALEVFGSDLYAADAMNIGSTIGVSMWDGSTWVDGGGTNNSHSVIYADGNDLYVVSDDGKIRKKTGTGSFQPFYDFAGNGGISSIIRYKGNLIFSGSFSSVNSVSANKIASWNGTTWQALGQGISGGAMCMAVYNNELYVAGKISTAGGNNVTSIAKWDGTNWSAVGGGVTGSCPNGIRDMITTANGLVIVGDFSKMGGVNTNNVALWNGSQWKSMGLTHKDAFINCVEMYNNKIYVGSFDFSHSHLYRFSGSLGVDDINNTTGITLYPNPASDRINIEIPNSTGDATIAICNITGQKMLEKNTIGNKEEIDIADLPAGIYFVHIKNGDELIIKKIVKV